MECLPVPYPRSYIQNRHVQVRKLLEEDAFDSEALLQQLLLTLDCIPAMAHMN